MPEIRHTRGCAWWLEQIVWGLLAGVPVGVTLALLYYLWVTG